MSALLAFIAGLLLGCIISAFALTVWHTANLRREALEALEEERAAAGMPRRSP